MTPGEARAAATTAAVHQTLRDHDLGPYLATPDGILAPLLTLLAGTEDYRVVSREENAIGLAAGIGLAGGHATVLLQNSGIGLSVNALASLVVPYRIPMLLLISQRGTDRDTTPENVLMGALTPDLLDSLGIARATLTPDGAQARIAVAATVVRRERRPYALLVPPALFGWEV